MQASWSAGKFELRLQSKQTSPVFVGCVHLRALSDTAAAAVAAVVTVVVVEVVVESVWGQSVCV